MKISILGTGTVGSALAKQWVEAGHDVVLAVRNPDSERAQNAHSATGGKAPLLSVSDACAQSEVILLATQHRDASAALQSAGSLDGKVVLDATNPLKPDLSGLTVGFSDSAIEELQREFPGAAFVKAFNTTGFNIMADPVLEGRKAVMFVCGDDAGAKTKALQLSNDCGFESIDAGPLDMARSLEPFAMLWIKLAYTQGLTRDYAFSLIRK